MLAGTFIVSRAISRESKVTGSVIFMPSPPPFRASAKFSVDWACARAASSRAVVVGASVVVRVGAPKEIPVPTCAPAAPRAAPTPVTTTGPI